MPYGKPLHSHSNQYLGINRHEPNVFSDCSCLAAIYGNDKRIGKHKKM
ncbi:hypothetical protein [Prevotella koreensis]|nr:hypothetical protein [Prevotella koreensis]